MRSPFRPLPARQEYALANTVSESFHFGEAFYPSRLRVDDHAHKNPSVTLVLQGSLTETYPRNRAERCFPCSILFRPAGERHWDIMGEGGSLNLEVELVDSRSFALPQIERLFEKPSQAHHPRLNGIALNIHTELQIQDAARPLVLEGLSLEFLGIASRLVIGLERSRVPPLWLCRVRDILHDCCRESVRIGQLAEEAGVHPVYLARIFRIHYGVTPGVYLRRLRLAWASYRVAKNPSISLSEIAAAAGFADQSHFTRAFTRQFGSPPGRVRQIACRPSDCK